MKHITAVSITNPLPAKAESLLAKNYMITNATSAIAALNNLITAGTNFNNLRCAVKGGCD